MNLKICYSLLLPWAVSAVKGGFNATVTSALLGSSDIPISEPSKACPRNEICYSVQDFDSEVEFTIQCPVSVGWVAIGTGKEMKDSNIIIAWKNTDNTITLSDRTATGHNQPTALSAQSSKLMPKSRVEGNTMTIIFRRMKSTGNPQEVVITNEMSDWIFAYSNARPTSSASNTSIKFHDGFGSMTLSLNNAVSTATATSSSPSASPSSTTGDPPPKKVNFYLLHGLLFFLGWNLIPYIGILAAGPMKAVLGVWWFRIHVAMMAFLGPMLCIAGFVLIVIKNGDHHFTSVHEILGLVIIIFQFLQIVSGIVIDRLYSPRRRAIPWYDKLHWYTGRILFVLAQINIVLGLYVYDKSPFMKPIWITFGCLIFFELSGLIIIRLIFRKSKSK